MADADSQAFKSQKPVPESFPDQSTTSKFFNHFLFKAAIVAVFLVLLPFFPSQAPGFVHQTIRSRSWELLQLIFVGLAVSYGLFSKKNNETDKESSTLKLDNAQSYVSKLLQVSSVFDDESENVTVVDGNKVQTWNSQYFRGRPVVVVAKENSSGKEEEGASSGICQKPLLLPVRSLKQRVLDPNEAGLVDGLDGEKGCFNMSSSKRFGSNSRRSRNDEFGELESKSAEEVEESNVFRSPIPWRSRSGRMEVKENEECSFSFPTFLDDSELSRLESRSTVSSRPNSSPKKPSSQSSVSSPRKLASSMSFSSESQAKNGEDMARKSYITAPSPVPPPPPPPPPSLRKSVLVKTSSSVTDKQVSSEKIMRRSLLSVPADRLRAGELDEVATTNSSPELRGKSVRTFRPIESSNIGTEKSYTEYESNFIEKKGYTSTRMNENIANPSMQNHAKCLKGDSKRFNEQVFEEPTCEESDDAESEDDYSQGSEEAAVDNSVSDAAPDVDKKADEFIAKFREQIRLQRIDSIRRSTTQRIGKTLA